MKLKKLLLNFILCPFLLACGGGGSGGSNSDGLGGDTSEKVKEQIRFLNAIKSESSVNVQLGEDIFIEELAYADATSYLEGPEGQKIEFVVTSAEKAVPILSATPTVIAGAKQSYILSDTAGKIELKVVDEKVTEPLPNQLRLRFINLSEDKASVDVYLLLPGEDLEDVTPAKSALAFKSLSDYIAVPTGTYDIVYTEAGSNTVIRRAKSVVFESGKVYSHYLVDNIGSTIGQTSRIIEDKVF